MKKTDNTPKVTPIVLTPQYEGLDELAQDAERLERLAKEIQRTAKRMKHKTVTVTLKPSPCTPDHN